MSEMSRDALTDQAVPIHVGLKTFVESAISDTPELCDEQIDSIRERLQYWYEYYGKHLSFMPLDFTDTEETRWLHQYFRQTLSSFITGWDTLEHVYWSVEALMIGFYNEYTRLAIEQRERSERGEVGEVGEVAETTAEALTEDLPLTQIEPASVPATQKKSPARTKRSTAATASVNPPTDSVPPDQFSLFG